MNRPGGSDNGGFDERFRGDSPRDSEENSGPSSKQQRQSYGSSQYDSRNWNTNSRNEFGSNRNDSYHRRDFGGNNFGKSDSHNNQNQQFDEPSRGRQDDNQFRGDQLSMRTPQNSDYRNERNGQSREYDRSNDENQGRFREEQNSYPQDRYDCTNRSETHRNEQFFGDRRHTTENYPMQRQQQDEWTPNYNRNNNGGRNQYEETDDRFCDDGDRSRKNDYRQGYNNRQEQGRWNNRGNGRGQSESDQIREERWCPTKESIETLTELERRRASNICDSMEYHVHELLGNDVIKLNPARKFGDIANAHTVETLLKDVGYRQLRPIQKVASPYIYSGNDVFLRSSSGSGKTAAYLMPLVAQIVQEKTKTTMKDELSPFVLIICPSLELVKHIYEVALVFCADTSVTCGMVAGNMDYNTHVLNNKADILVGSPLKLAHMLETNKIFLRSTFSIVVEEADWYWDVSAEALKKIFEFSEDRQQRICVTGTYPSAFGLPYYFRKNFGVICYTKEPLPAVIHRFERVNQFSFTNKLLQEVKDKKGELHKCLIVCHSLRVRTQVLQLFADNKIEAKDYIVLRNEGLTISEREALLNRFTNDNIRVLVSTDNALLRGIRLSNVRKVIHLDAPITTERTPSPLCTFHHRLGPVAFSTDGESVFLLNVDEKSNLEMVKILSEVLEVVPDWMYRVARQGCWIVDDKAAADVAAKEPEEEKKVESADEDERQKRRFNYNPQYPRQDWGRNRYRSGNSYNNHHYNHQYNTPYCGPYYSNNNSNTNNVYPNYPNNTCYTTDPVFQAFEGLKMTPQFQQQVQRMYAPPVPAPFVAPDRQLVFEGNQADYSPILLNQLALTTIKNDDGYMQVFQMKRPSSEAKPNTENVTTATTELKVSEPAVKETEPTSTPQHSPADSCGSSFIQVETPKSDDEDHAALEKKEHTDPGTKDEHCGESSRTSDNLEGCSDVTEEKKLSSPRIIAEDTSSET